MRILHNEMKTIIIFSLFILLLLMGCKNEPQYSRFENHNVPACGIADPLNNLPWLKAYCSEHLNSSWVSISIRKNSTSDVNYIVIENSNTISVYSCEGERLMFHSSGSESSDGWMFFLGANPLVAKIWEVKEN